jgi:LPXTG-motif cell wall-anchored protein
VAGTYRTIASYSGNAGNAPVTTKCNDNNESVVGSAAPAPKPTPTPSTTVLGSSQAKKPLPVTGPSVPVGPLGILGVALVVAGAALLRRRRSGSS